MENKEIVAARLEHSKASEHHQLMIAQLQNIQSQAKQAEQDMVKAYYHLQEVKVSSENTTHIGQKAKKKK